MKEGVPATGYDPHSPFTTPFTIISTVKHRFASKPLAQPFCCEVYCPLSCKKVKIGVKKGGKLETIEFNSTTNRVVSLYAKDNLKYLVNRHKPNKNDKKSLDGKEHSIAIEVEDKGNVAIFNPYCIDPLQPISFFVNSFSI